MHFAKHKRRRAPSVIIVSLIDVLLVVLIFLMVTTTFKKLEPALQLSLPEAREAQMGTVEPTAFVIIVATNFPYFYWQDQPVSLNRLEKELQLAAAQDPQVRVDIRADKKAPFGEVIKVIDAAKMAKVGSINAITEKTVVP